VTKAEPRPSIGDDAALARDHLANERTYLAWLRTAVNVMILGLAVAKLLRGEGSSADVAGGVLIAVGFVVLVFGTMRTRRITTELREGTYEADYVGPILVAGLVAVGVAAAAVLLFA
jgi:putative membrane protein